MLAAFQMATDVGTISGPLAAGVIAGLVMGLIPGLGGTGAVAILLAAYSFVLDFENISDGVKRGIPKKAAWSAAFGLTVTLIWAYVEILRVLSIIRSMSD